MAALASWRAGAAAPAAAVLALVAALRRPGSRAEEDRPNASATIALDAPPAAVDAGLELALVRDFSAEGVELRLQAPSVRTTALERLVSARAQFAILDIHDLAGPASAAATSSGHGDRAAAARRGRRRPVGPAPAPAEGARGRFGRAGGRRGAGGGRAPRRRRRPNGAAGADGRARPPPRCIPAGWRPRGRWDADGVALLAARPGAHAFRADDYGAPA